MRATESSGKLAAMLRTSRSFLGAGVFGALVVTSLASPAPAAKLTAADRAWIDTCMAQRQMSKEQPKKLRKYCTCMQEVVDDNEPFDSISALEHTYPPAHQMCWKDAGRK
jgi:invasion protein IalB